MNRLIEELDRYSTITNAIYLSPQEAKAFKKELNDVLSELRNAVADYMWSEGCTCCENIEDHAEHKKRLAELLDIEQFDDGSGYDFYKYATERVPGINEPEVDDG